MSLLSPAIAEVSVEATAALAAASTEASSSGPGFAPTAVDPTCAMNRSDGNRRSPFGVETQAGRSPVGIGPFDAQAQRTNARVALFIEVSPGRVEPSGSIVAPIASPVTCESRSALVSMTV